MEILLMMCLIVILIFYLRLKSYKKKSKEELKKEFQKEFDEERRKLSQQLSDEKFKTAAEIAAEQSNREQQLYAIRKHNSEVIQLENDKAALELKATKKEIENAREQVRIELSGARELEIQSINYDLERRRKEAQENYKMFLSGLDKELQQKKDHCQIQIDEIEETLNDFKRKQEIVGQEILRRRAIEEQQDFYRVYLSDEQLRDIEVLKEVIPKLINRSNLNKLIYDVYCSKEVQSMAKRILNGGQPSGIYKITRMKTGEIYIGKSTNVRDRWIQHCKTACGCGTIAHSILHTTMEKDGLQNFTFELLEEVPKEKLSEREKYWINFYKSKEYGMNEKEG